MKDTALQFDVNNDGKIDEKDVKLIYDKYSKFLLDKVPSTAGFSVGLYLGLRGKFL